MNFRNVITTHVKYANICIRNRLETVFLVFERWSIIIIHFINIFYVPDFRSRKNLDIWFLLYLATITSTNTCIFCQNKYNSFNLIDVYAMRREKNSIEMMISGICQLFTIYFVEWNLLIVRRVSYVIFWPDFPVKMLFIIIHCRHLLICYCIHCERLLRFTIIVLYEDEITGILQLSSIKV